MGIDVRKIYNANVYVDGANFLGRVEEATLAEIKMKMTEHKAVGMIGSVEFPSGIEKMEASLKWAGAYNEAMLLSNPFVARKIMIRASVEKYDATGRVSEVPAVFTMTATAKNAQGGSFKQHDNWDATTQFNVTSIKIEYGGIAVLEYDAMANIYKVAGADILAQYKANTGAV